MDRNHRDAADRVVFGAELNTIQTTTPGTQPAADTQPQAPRRSAVVRFHDLRHSFATMNLSAGEHYMQVSKWLGHSSFVLTLTTYADYINETELAAPKVGRGVANLSNNVRNFRRAVSNV